MRKLNFHAKTNLLNTSHHFSLSSSAQGSWDIGYFPVDTLNDGHVGRIVRIDFKTPKIKQGFSNVRHIRSYVGNKDPGFVIIDTTVIVLAEKRQIYADHGSFDDQFLECLNCKNFSLRIYDAEIPEVDKLSILFRIETKQIKKGSEKSDKAYNVIRIEKAKLDGVLYKE